MLFVNPMHSSFVEQKGKGPTGLKTLSVYTDTVLKYCKKRLQNFE
ncbi:MAG: hypothetical protein NPIRA06_23170 [Nitrospirales bacterium]|nr:MAG: hypothetical protein NPIRA06_23170 [Nitrospirales bacterium]